MAPPSTDDRFDRRLLRAAGVAALLWGLTACQSGGMAAGGSSASPSPSESATAAVVPEQPTEPPESPEPDAEPTASTVDAGAAEGGSGEVSYVEFGDVRYEAESMQCTTNDGGFEFGGDASGPYPGMVTIGGVFGLGSSEDPPDVAFAMFDAGQGGLWSAMSEVGGFSIGALSDVSYSAAGASGQGTFAFHLEGSIDPATVSGRFEFFC